MQPRFIEYSVRTAHGGTVLCEPDWSWHPPVDRFRDLDLWFVWAGRGEMRLSGITHTLGPGSVFCLRPGNEYHATHDPKHRLGVCYQHFDFVDARQRVMKLADKDLPPHASVLDDVGFHEQLLRRAVTLAQGDELQRRQASQLVMHVLLAMQWQQGRPRRSPVQIEQESRLAPVLRHIREHPGELFSIEDLADRAGYSVDHFTRVFKNQMGMSPKEFCIRVRLDRAKQLLRESALSVEQIARALGYADMFFFSRQFKDRIGVPPTKWRG